MVEIIGKDINLLQDIIKEFLNYNINTGVFTWKNKKSLNTIIDDESGCIDKSTGYRRIRINNKLYYSHRLAWLYYYGIWPKDKVDHINGNKTDNRISNLREVTNSENMMNQKVANKLNKLNTLGVCLDKRRNKFRATIQINGTQVWLGYFNTVEEAHQAYLESKRELHITCTI